MHINQFIKAILLLALVLLNQACSDIKIEQPLERFISDEEIISSMRSILITEGAYIQPQDFLNPNLWAAYLNLGNITDICNIEIDTTFATVIDETDIKLDADSELFFSMYCNDNGLPSSFSYNGASEGSYSTEQVSGTFLQASSYLAKIEFIEGNLAMSGSTGQSGAMTIALGEKNEKVVTTISFVLEDLNIGFLDQEVKKGSARAALKFQGTNFLESYIATIQYLGDDQITIEVNGEMYNIDLSE